MELRIDMHINNFYHIKTAFISMYFSITLTSHVKVKSIVIHIVSKNLYRDTYCIRGISVSSQPSIIVG